MEYLITFDDGSDGYLSHHGVLGMKWGVRNAETQARYSNGPQASKSAAKKKKLAKAALIAGGALTVAAVAGTPQGRALMKKGAASAAKSLKKSRSSVSLPKHARTNYDRFERDAFRRDVFRPDVFRPDVFRPDIVKP